MNGLKQVGLIEEPHGHKGAVKVKPLNGDDLQNLGSVFLVDGKGNTMQKEIYEVKKYRRGRFLIKFSGLKWRNEIEGLRHFAIAI